MTVTQLALIIAAVYIAPHASVRHGVLVGLAFIIMAIFSALR